MKSASGYMTDHQKAWRRVASVSLLLSAAMAVFGVTSSLVRDTLIHMATRSSDGASELTATIPAWACALYWVVLAVLLLVTSYIALLDMRFIRLQFALEKRALLEQSWGDEEFRDMLRKAQESHGSEKNPEPSPDSSES